MAISTPRIDRSNSEMKEANDPLLNCDNKVFSVSDRSDFTKNSIFLYFPEIFFQMKIESPVFLTQFAIILPDRIRVP